MNTSELRSLLDDVPDTFELVLRREPDCPALAAWREAAEEASHALRHWRVTPGAYSVYRAAQDREDAAFDALVQTQTSRTSVS